MASMRIENKKMIPDSKVFETMAEHLNVAGEALDSVKAPSDAFVTAAEMVGAMATTLSAKAAEINERKDAPAPHSGELMEACADVFDSFGRLYSQDIPERTRTTLAEVAGAIGEVFTVVAAELRNEGSAGDYTASELLKQVLEGKYK